MRAMAAAVVLAICVALAARAPAQAIFDSGPLPAPRPFPPGRALIAQAFKLAPADMELWLDGRRIET
ncbi:MAG: hypothetical protein Q8M76_17530, partial [Spirochaetaceae bacterium]|nr:hypothetical protein [Spirochaetaceae bacterium]